MPRTPPSKLKINFIEGSKPLTSTTMMLMVQTVLFIIVTGAQAFVTYTSVENYISKMVWMPFYFLSALFTVTILLNMLTPAFEAKKTSTESIILWGGLLLFTLASGISILYFPDNITLLPVFAFMFSDLMNSIILNSGCLSSALIAGLALVLLVIAMYYRFRTVNPAYFLGGFAALISVFYALQALLFEKKKEKPSTTNYIVMALLGVSLLLFLFLLYSNKEYFFMWPTLIAPPAPAVASPMAQAFPQVPQYYPQAPATGYVPGVNPFGN